MGRVVLTGFMGAGKSTLGPLLAERLGWRFVDTDALVEAREGRAIEALFAEGEARFRAAERAAIESLFAHEDLVVAVGGGAIAEPATRALMQALGPLVALDAPLETLWERAGADPARPLSQDRARFEALHASRRALYAACPVQLDTALASPGEAVERLAAQLRAPGETVRVPLDARSYDIVIAPGALARLGEHLAAHLSGSPGRCLVVTDATVGALYADGALESLRRAGFEPTLATIPAGEASKSFAEAERLYDAAVEAGLRRHHPIVALGGGVVGDLAGFVASTYQRGVPFVQVPTSLLAMVDSAVGGKVAINHPGGKNLIGAFYQPRLVLADPWTLCTLSEREYRAGLAEALKYGVIMAPALFEAMEREIPLLNERDGAALARLVAWCCRLKAEVVGEDETEQAGGRRVILNFGHTLGHALEAVAGYGTLLHGEAVAIGMVAAGRAASKLGLWSSEAQGRLEALLTALGLPTERPAGLAPEALLVAMGRDKKNAESGITYVLPKALGDVLVAQWPPSTLAALLDLAPAGDRAG